MGNFYASACLMALAVSSPALAQTAEQDDTTTLGDIVVTAQRRSETLQSVPIAVTAISAETTAALNIEDLKDLQIVTPGLNISTGVGYAMTFIRGVGATFSSPGVENPVAVYIDGAYVERGKGGNLDIMDPGSIQVLKGPQGTLYGRNATGGAIIVTTADPQFKNSGQLVGELGNQGHRSVDGFVNVPLSDKLAVRVSGRFRTDGGYIRNLPDNYKFGWADNYSIRGKVLWQPTSEFSAVLGIQHDSRKASMSANSQFLPNNFCLNCDATGYTFPLADPFTTSINLLNGGLGIDAKNDLYTARLTYQADKLTITSNTGYNKNSTIDAFDADLSNINTLNFIIPSTNKTFTQNVTATTSLGGAIEGLVGVDFLDDTSTYAINFVPNLLPPFQPVDLATVKTKSFSPYAELNFKPAPHLTVTAGGRYTHDTREVSRRLEPNKSLSFNSFSPRVVIAYDAGVVNLYASFNQGTKAGGFSTPSRPATSFLPEKLTAYEVGAKFVSSDRRFRLNLAAFHYDYNQLQVEAIDQSNTGVIGTVQNPDANINGFDFDFNWKPVSAVELFGGASILDTKYVNHGNAGVQIPLLNAQGQVIGTTTGKVSLTGTRLPHAPSFSGFIGATVSGSVADGMKGSLTGLVNYSSEFDFFSGAGGPIKADRQPGFATAKITGSIMPEDEHYEIGFYVDNVTNKLTYAFRFTTAPFGALQVVNRPRTYGVRVGVRY